MIRWLKCSLGLHAWRISAAIPVEGTGYTENPIDFESGGVDYVIRCAHCSTAYIERKRGFWIEPPYPKFDA